MGTRLQTGKFQKKIQALFVFVSVLLLFPVYSAFSKPHVTASVNTEVSLLTPLSVEIDSDDLLTLKGSNVPTEEVLAAVARTSNLDLHIVGSFNRNVTFSIEERPVLEVLLKVLKEQNFVSQHIHTIYDDDSQEELRRGELWVYSFEPGPKDHDASIHQAADGYLDNVLE